MSPSATPATQSDDLFHQAPHPPHKVKVDVTSVTPATQNAAASQRGLGNQVRKATGLRNLYLGQRPGRRP